MRECICMLVWKKSQGHVNMKTWFKTVDEYDPFYVIKYICMQKQKTENIYVDA